MRKFFWVIAVCAAAYGGVALAGKRDVRTRSAILIVGDGLGISLQNVLRLTDGPLAVDGMDDVAIVLTSSSEEVVTDSAAGATAIATGVKTRNGSVGVDRDGKRLTNIAEIAKKAGKRVGIVTTSYLWDATPAAFLAHVADRNRKEEIVVQALAARADLLLGGGEALMLPEGRAGTFGRGERDDGRSLAAEFAKAGYALTVTPTSDRPQVGVFAAEAMFEEKPARYRPRVALHEMVVAALEVLEGDDKGFLLVVEDEGPDEMAHAGVVAEALEAARGWDKAVRAALAYRAAHPEVAVIVVSDHDTGNTGITPVKECANGTPMKDTRGRAFCTTFPIRRHTAAPVAVYTAGIDMRETVIENTAVFTLLLRGLGLK